MPLPWGALSSLSVSPSSDDTLYAVPDSFYAKSSVFTIDRSQAPARLVESLRVVDSDSVLGNALRLRRWQPS